MFKKKKSKNKLSNSVFLLTIIFFLFICTNGLLLFVYLDNQELFSKITNFELKQSGTSIIATWDDMDCDCFEIVVKAGEDETYMKTIDKHKYIIENVLPDTKYTVSVKSVLDYNLFTEKENASIVTKSSK